MSDERFYNQVRATVEGFAPTVSGNVYSGMRRKLWWSRFTRFDASRFNMWYLLLLVGIGGSLAMNEVGGTHVAIKIDAVIAAPIVPVGNSTDISTQPDVASTGNPSVTEKVCVGSGCCSKAKNSASAPRTSASRRVTFPAESTTPSADPLMSASETRGTPVVASNVAETPPTETPKETTPIKSKGKKGLTVKTYVDSSSGER